MTGQKKGGGSLTERYGIPPVTDARLLSCRMLTRPPSTDAAPAPRICSQPEAEEPILLKRKTSRPPPPPPANGRRSERTMELDDEALFGIVEGSGSQPTDEVSGGDILSEEPIRPSPEGQAQPAGAARSERTMELRADEIIDVTEGSGSQPIKVTTADIVVEPAPAKSRPPPVPPPRERPKTVRPPPAREPSESLITSLADLQRLGAEPRIREAPAAPPAVSTNSVEVSLKDLLRLEEERVAAEKAGREAKERAAQELSDKRSGFLGVLKARKDAEQRKIDDECEALEREEASRAVDELLEGLEPDTADAPVEEAKPPSMEISISVEMVLGIPWDEAHATYRLDEGEISASESVLPERALRWLLPVPPIDTEDAAGRSVLDRFAKEPTVTLNGKRYYVISGEEGFADARRVARTGNTLHIWQSAMVDYEFLGERDPSGATLMTGEWSLDLRFHKLSEEEIAAFGHALPEGKPLWLHPLPDSAVQGDMEKAVLEACARMQAKRVRLNGREYFVFEVKDIEEWRSVTFMFEKTRLASRKDQYLNIWPEAENGQKLLSADHGFGMTYYGPAGPPLMPQGGFVRPHGMELEHLVFLYEGGKKRYLYAMPDKLGDLDADTLNFLVSVGNREIELTGHTPLVSLQGRWYMALQYPIPESRATSMEGNRIRVFPKAISPRDALEEVKKKLQEKRKDREPPQILLPSVAEYRVPLLRMFPEGEPRYLVYVEPSSRHLVRDKPIVSLFREGERDTYLVLTEPHEGAVAVVRRRDIIVPLES
ncbi:MAG: hypothetical protein AB1529_02565 [Candidatus Micrarchaeota archaeon]